MAVAVLGCGGRSCPKCDKCTDWEFKDNNDTRTSIHVAKNRDWSPEDIKHWYNDRIYDHLKIRNGRCCGYRLTDTGNIRIVHYYDNGDRLNFNDGRIYNQGSRYVPTGDDRSYPGYIFLGDHICLCD
ncbi:unnamed protein product [Rotaria magnacalcarata]|uniref:Uncharacterized protein n=1 Tax=Rotaria magnacalcarata TaxID=392030 RepID=A0A820IGG9_9BILA|nr:unnamed protein product [Rotaria magnacalcarata]CAF1447018.1 unnamed protein product [Rotaria magnacalcarata]CAF2065038.1 unnamed protein product [Rotaria magnacalcarata]CAF2068332.1 unnamed protein product [Rotaria magnacalcarata]CAF2273408.1 unnamed protein product [Rotaria magnacalcarata]